MLSLDRLVDIIASGEQPGIESNSDCLVYALRGLTSDENAVVDRKNKGENP